MIYDKPHIPHRCGARTKKSNNKRPCKLKPSIRSWKFAALLDAVRQYVLIRRSTNEDSITAEEIASALRAKKGDVTGCLVKLVSEGLVGRKKKVVHDDCWWPSVYFLPKVKEHVS